MTNRELAQEISARIGNSPIPFDSVYSIALQIYNELGGEETQFDSVYSILLEILPLVEGGGSGKAIEEVSELPEASENKDKLFRLDNGDKDVYAARLISSESFTTNRLPDAQQIDKAYLYEGNETVYYYKGAYTITCTDGVLNWYLWENEAHMVATEENFPSDFINVPIIEVDAESEYWSDVTETGATTTMSVSEVENDDTMGGWGIMALIPAIYNAPESAQIGNAYISSDDSIKFYYTGEETTIEIEGETINVYSWFNNDGEGHLYSTKPASGIYYSASDEPHTPIMTDTKFYGGGEEWNIYVAHIVQLNAPDEQQVDNAYISHPEIVSDIATYGGVKTFYCTDGTLDLYEWYEGDKEYPSYRLFTTIPASDLYEHAYEIPEEGISDVYNVDWDSYNIEATVAELQTLLDNAYKIKWNCTTEEYTREVVIEEWGWKSLTDTATNDDIDLMFVKEIKLIRYQDAEQEEEGFVDWWVNTSGETMEFEGETYFKWVSWANDESDGSEPPVANPNHIMLTNTLNISLPFNSESPEFEYSISYNSESEEWGDMGYFHGDYIQKTVQ